MKKNTLEFTSVAVTDNLVMAFTQSGHGELVHNPAEANALRLLLNSGMVTETHLEEMPFAQSA